MESNNMQTGYTIILCILAGISLVTCHCPPEKMHSTGECRYRMTCIGTIQNVQLPQQCLEAANYPVTVQVTLNEAIERFDSTIDIDFLATITDLRISAQWKETNLAMLQYTTKLQALCLSGMGLEKITGTPFYYLSSLEDLNLSHNSLREIKELFQFGVHPNKLKRLSLAYNVIEDIPGFIFDELSSLTELDLSYNIISDLTEEPFYNLTTLAILRLNNNRIKDLNGAVNSLLNLKHLYLRGNQIQNIDDESLKIIEHLQTFDVSWNELEQIKPILFSRHWEHFGNHSVCKIILSQNHISSVPNGTALEISSRYRGNFEKNHIDLLTELDLSANAISNIEYNSFQSLIRVESLNLSKNKIIDFYVNASDLAYVKYLNLSSNYISHLYFESFALMNNLVNLDLSYNRLDFIPDMSFNNNINLKLVNMTFNEFEKLDSIHIKMFHAEGGVLDLSNNGLFKLKIPCGEGLRMVTLLLHSNNISDSSLIDLSQQTELQTLDMSENAISELNISSLHLPVNLINLDLGYNHIQRIGPSTFHTLSHLRKLRLNRNRLTVLEYGTFQGLPALVELNLSYNRIGFLDSKMLMDLKSLQFLSVRSNDMNYLDYKTWYGHRFDLVVYVDNNNLTCEWLGRALSDYHNGFSRMRPAVLVSTNPRNSVEDIPCVADVSAAYTDVGSHYVMADDRLLVTSQKILEAVREQNSFIWKFLKITLAERGREKCIKKDC